MALRIHHLNCGTLCPISRALFNGQGSLFEPGQLVCHCLLIETEQGLVLVDTGLGLQDVKARQVAPVLDWFSPPRYALEETAIAQVRKLGFQAEDVKHLILTHLDVDHAGGIRDFPQARVHVHRFEYQSRRSPRSWLERLRYPRQDLSEQQWQTYQPLGERWFGFDAVRPLVGLCDQILLIPLVGHTRGHSGVAIQTDGGWVLHCGDAYFDHRQLRFPFVDCPPGLLLLQGLESANQLQLVHNQLRLSQLRQQHPEIQLLCSHDPIEFQRLLKKPSNH